MRQMVPFDMRIIRVTLSTTSTPLSTLVKAAFAAKSIDLPNAQVYRITMYGSTSFTVYDNVTGDFTTVAATTRTTFESANIMDRISLKGGTPTVDIELYFGQ